MRKIPDWLDLVGSADPEERKAVRERKRGEQEKGPEEWLKERLKEEARADYELCKAEYGAKREKMAAKDRAREAARASYLIAKKEKEERREQRKSLKAAAKQLNSPSWKAIDLEVGETLEEKVKMELAKRGGSVSAGGVKWKRFSKALGAGKERRKAK